MISSIQYYFQQLHDALNTVSSEDFDRATAILAEAYEGDHTIYVIGNGQSATTASAFALDLAKQTACPTKRPFRILSLTDNTAAITAWANDVSYERIFTEQLRCLFRPHDVVLAISASGNSPNVVHACEWARAQRGKVIALAGFEGGTLRSLADACLIVRIHDYGHIETAHLALMHYWVDYFREQLAK